MGYKGDNFYQVIRVFQKNGSMNNSVQYFDEYEDSQKRFYAVIAADLADDSITYNAAYLINGYGAMVKVETFDRRPVRPEE